MSERQHTRVVFFDAAKAREQRAQLELWLIERLEKTRASRIQIATDRPEDERNLTAVLFLDELISDLRRPTSPDESLRAELLGEIATIQTPDVLAHRAEDIAQFFSRLWYGDGLESYYDTPMCVEDLLMVYKDVLVGGVQ